MSARNEKRRRSKTAPKPPRPAASRLPADPESCLQTRIRFNWPAASELGLSQDEFVALLREGQALLVRYPVMAAAAAAVFAASDATTMPYRLLREGFKQGSPLLREHWYQLFVRAATLPQPAKHEAVPRTMAAWDLLVRTFYQSTRHGTGCFTAEELFEFTNSPFEKTDNTNPLPPEVSTENLIDAVVTSGRPAGDVKVDVEDLLHRLYSECANALCQEGMRAQMTAIVQVLGVDGACEAIRCIASGEPLPEISLRPSPKRVEGLLG